MIEGNLRIRDDAIDFAPRAVTALTEGFALKARFAAHGDPDRAQAPGRRHPRRLHQLPSRLDPATHRADRSSLPRPDYTVPGWWIQWPCTRSRRPTGCERRRRTEVGRHDEVGPVRLSPLLPTVPDRSRCVPGEGQHRLPVGLVRPCLPGTMVLETRRSLEVFPLQALPTVQPADEHLQSRLLESERHAGIEVQPGGEFRAVDPGDTVADELDPLGRPVAESDRHRQAVGRGGSRDPVDRSQGSDQKGAEAGETEGEWCVARRASSVRRSGSTDRGRRRAMRSSSPRPAR